jgi:O-antigen/teichoic acid export membrane protein
LSFKKHKVYSFSKNLKKSSVLYINNIMVISSCVFDQTILKGLGVGYVSLMKYSSIFTDVFINGIIIMLLNNIIFPKISKKYDDFNEYLKYGKLIVYLSIVILLLMIFVAPIYLDIIRLRVETRYISTIYIFIMFTSFSIIPIALNMYVNMYFLIQNYTHYIFVTCLIFVICKILFTYILSVFFGAYGVMAGTLVSEYITLIIAIIILISIKSIPSPFRRPFL